MQTPSSKVSIGKLVKLSFACRAERPGRLGLLGACSWLQPPRHTVLFIHEDDGSAAEARGAATVDVSTRREVLPKGACTASHDHSRHLRALLPCSILVDDPLARRVGSRRIVGHSMLSNLRSRSQHRKRISSRPQLRFPMATVRSRISPTLCSGCEASRVTRWPCAVKASALSKLRHRSPQLPRAPQARLRLLAGPCPLLRGAAVASAATTLVVAQAQLRRCGRAATYWSATQRGHALRHIVPLRRVGAAMSKGCRVRRQRARQRRAQLVRLEVVSNVAAAPAVVRCAGAAHRRM